MKHHVALFATVAAAVATSLVSAHGYLSLPEPRGIEKEAYNVDALKSPNTRGLCRGEPVGKVHRVRAGQQLTLTLTITAPHTGPCRVTLLDTDLRNERPVADKYDCAAPGKVEPWTITLPQGARGRQVLRWFWQGRHVSPGEDYEQCIDLDFGGGGDGDDVAETYDAPQSADAPKRREKDGASQQQPSSPPPPSPSLTEPESPRAAPEPRTPAVGNDEADASPLDNGADAGGEPVGSQQPARSFSRRPARSGGACQDGAYRCRGNGGFEQCAHGHWSALMQCAAGTRCRQTGKTIACA